MNSEELRGLSEYRSENGGGTIIGYAAVFNSPANIMDDFTETIAPGAFAESLRTNEVFAYNEHDLKQLIGATHNGTLRLNEDEKGLRVEIDLPETSVGSDVRALIKDGYVRGMSFGFSVTEGGDVWSSDLRERKITNVNLFEVSTTHNPAFVQTSVSVRSRFKNIREHNQKHGYARIRKRSMRLGQASRGLITEPLKSEQFKSENENA
ncbi:MAG: HK97 family phage prohead protease [Pseudomonadota bacterium]